MIKTFIIWANWACIKSSRKLVMWESLYLGKKSGKTTFVFLNHLLGHKFSKRLQLRLLLIIWVRKSAIKRQKKIVILQTKFSCYEIWPTNGTHTQWLNSIDCRQVFTDHTPDTFCTENMYFSRERSPWSKIYWINKHPQNNDEAQLAFHFVKLDVWIENMNQKV